MLYLEQPCEHRVSVGNKLVLVLSCSLVSQGRDYQTQSAERPDGDKSKGSYEESYATLVQWTGKVFMVTGFSTAQQDKKILIDNMRISLQADEI